MSENYNIQIGVDASQAESGVKRFDTALKNTIKSLNSFDQSASKAFQSFSSSTKNLNFSSLASQTSAFSRASAKISSDLAVASKSFTQFSKAAASAMNEVSRAAARVDFSKITAQTKAMNTALGSISATSNKAVGAINNIAKALGDLNSVMTGTGKKGTNSLAQALAGLNSIKIDPTLTRNLRTLGTSLDTIKAPSANTIRAISALGALGSVRVPAGLGTALSQIGGGLSGINASSISALRALPAALSGLSAIRVSPSTVQALGALGKSLSGISVPSGQGISLLRALLSTLSSARINPQVAQGLSTFAQALSQFQGPSPSAIANTARLLAVMGSANVANVARVSAALRQLQTSLANTGQRSVQTGQQMNSAFAQAFPRLSRLQGDMRGLENTFSLSYNAASVFRTALGGLTMGRFTTEVYEAGTNLQTFSQAMSTVSGSSEQLAQHISFVQNLTRRMPIELAAAQEGYKGFATAALLAGTSVKDTQMIFQNFAGAFTVLGLNTEQTKYSFLALQQIMSKGRFSMEELRRQLGEQLPGTMQILAQAVSKVKGRLIDVNELISMVENGSLDSSYLVAFGKEIGEVFGPQLERALNTPQAKLNNLRTAFKEFGQTIYSSGFSQGLGVMFDQLDKGLRSEKFQEAARNIGKAFQEIFIWVGTLGRVAAENIDTIAKFGAAIAAWGLFTGAAAALRALLSPMTLFGGAAVAAAMGANTMAVAMVALGAASIGPDLLNGSLMRLMKTAAKLGAVLEIGALGVKAVRALGTNDDGSNVAQGLFDQYPKLAEALRTLGGVADGVHETVADAFTSTAEAAVNPTEKIEKLKETMKGITDLIQQGGDPSKMIGSIGELIEQNRKLAESVGVAQKSQEEYDKTQKMLTDNAYQQKAALQDNEKKVLDFVGSIRKAQEELRDYREALESLRKAGEEGFKKGISREQYDAYMQILHYKTKNTANPVQGMVEDLGQELSLLQKQGDARTLEQKFIQQRNALMEKGVVLTNDQEKALRKVNEAMLDLERGGSNGFQRYANSVKDFREALIDVEQNGISQLSDALAELSVNGQADFAALGKSILKTFNKALIDSLFKDMFSSFGSESPLAQLFGAGKQNNASQAKGLLGQFAGLPGINTQIANVQASVVNVSGGLPGATPAGLPTDITTSKALPPLPGSPVDPNYNKSLVEKGVAASTPAPSTAAAGATQVAMPQSLAAAPATAAAASSQAGVMPPASSFKSVAEYEAYKFNASGGKTMIPSPSPDVIPGGMPAGGVPAGVIPSGGQFGAIDAMKGQWSEGAKYAAQAGGVSLDPRLVDIMKHTQATTGLKVEAISGVADRAAGTTNHSSGRAMDVQLFDKETGKPLGNYQDASSFRQYEQFAQNARQYQMEKYPELSENFRWGGYFSGGKKYGALDSMHFDLSGKKDLGMAGGSWAGGLTAQQREYYPGVQSIGMGAASKMSAQAQPMVPGKDAIDPDYLARVRQIESGNDPLSNMDKTTQYKGLYQLNNGEMAKYNPGGNLYNAADQQKAFEALTRDNATRFKADYGRDPSKAESYLMHQQGEGGLRKMLANPEGNAYQTGVNIGGNLPKDVKAQYGDQMTNQQYMDYWQGRVGQGNTFVDTGATGSLGTSGAAAAQQQMLSQQTMMTDQMAQMTQPIQAASQSAMSSFNQVGSAVAQAGSQAGTSSGLFGSLGNSLEQMFSQMGSGGGGGGGGGLFGGLFNMFGMFKEGGVSTAPVTALAAASSFRNMPHYSEGTDMAARAPGTPSMGGGFGAVLHDNEAVIPLTRGREVPVKMAGGRGGAGGTTVVNMTVNGVKDVSGFNRSKSQIAAGMSTAMTQATQKQN